MWFLKILTSSATTLLKCFVHLMISQDYFGFPIYSVTYIFSDNETLFCFLSDLNTFHFFLLCCICTILTEVGTVVFDFFLIAKGMSSSFQHLVWYSVEIFFLVGFIIIMIILTMSNFLGNFLNVFWISSNGFCATEDVDFFLFYYVSMANHTFNIFINPTYSE